MLTSPEPTGNCEIKLLAKPSGACGWNMPVVSCGIRTSIHFIGQIKATVVYCLPFLITLFVLQSMLRYGVRFPKKRVAI